MADFTDIDGKPVFPGCVVLVASTGTSRARLVRGMVYRTQLKMSRWGRERTSISLRDPTTKRYIGTFRNPKAMVVVSNVIAS